MLLPAPDHASVPTIMRCPNCGSRETVLVGHGADGAPPAPGADGKLPMSCPSCQSTFVLDERSSIVSVRDGTRTVRRPEGVVIVAGAAQEGSIYRSAQTDTDVRLGVFAPHFGKFGPIVLAVGCCYVTVASMKALRAWPWVDYLPLVGVLAFYALLQVGYNVWPRLKGASHQLRLTRDTLIAVEHGREVVRCHRDEVARAACVGETIAYSGSRPSATRYHLAVFDRSGRRFLLWENVSREHGAFAEAWLEEHLGLPERAPEKGLDIDA